MKTKFIPLILALLTAFSTKAAAIKSDSLIISEYVKMYNLALKHSKTNTKYALDCAFKAKDMAVEMNDAQKRAKSNTLMGDIFKNNKSYPTAITYYEKAISDLEILNDYKKINKLYIEIAHLYQNSKFDYEWSIEAMDNAYRYAKILNNGIIYLNTFMAYGDLYQEQNNDSLALYYYDVILNYPLTKCNIKYISEAMTNKANILINNKQYNDAMALIDSSLYLSIRDFNDKLSIENYSLKGEIYDSLKQPDLAEKYYSKAIDISYSIGEFVKCAENMFKLGLLRKNNHSYDSAIEIFKILSDSTQYFKMYNFCSSAFLQLAKCYASVGRFEDAYKVHLNYEIYLDSANLANEKQKIEELRNQYILSLNVSELNAKEMELQNLKQRRYNHYFTIMASLIILVMLIIFLILYSHHKVLKHKHIEAEYLQKIKLDEMEKNMIELQLKSNKESLVNLAFYLKSYIEFISPVKDDIKDAMDMPESEIKAKIRSIYLNLQNNISLFNKMNELQDYIDGLYNDFLTKIEDKYPNLTKAEKRLCVLLYIDLSSKEIAVITNTTLRTVETSRYRLRKKFELEKDEDMVDFLKNI